MTRLDIFLVENKLISTRSRAKRAIIYGLIKVNGKIIQKPAYSIKSTDHIEILSEIASKSAGYWKLYALTRKFNTKIFNTTDRVLDLGSSAGGFLEYAAEHCKEVFGIEVSSEFAPKLDQLKHEYPNISILIADVFTLNLKQISEMKQVDLLLNDLTLEPPESVKILLKFLPLLKSNGYIIMAVKQGNNSLDYCKKIIQKTAMASNLELLQVIDLDPDKKELHFLAKKKG